MVQMQGMGSASPCIAIWQKLCSACPQDAQTVACMLNQLAPGCVTWQAHDTTDSTATLFGSPVAEAAGVQQQHGAPRQLHECVAESYEEQKAMPVLPSHDTGTIWWLVKHPPRQASILQKTPPKDPASHNAGKGDQRMPCVVEYAAKFPGGITCHICHTHSCSLFCSNMAQWTYQCPAINKNNKASCSAEDGLPTFKGNRDAARPGHHAVGPTPAPAGRRDSMDHKVLQKLHCP